MAHLITTTRDGQPKVEGSGERTYIAAEALPALGIDPHSKAPVIVDGATYYLGEYIPKANLYRAHKTQQ